MSASNHRLFLRLRIFCIAGLAALLLSAGSPVPAQKLSPEDRFAQARAMYYIPSGLTSLHCDISIDWKYMLLHFGGKQVADDDPYLHYLNSARLSVTDDLNGETKLSWANIGSPPTGTEDAATKMRTGIEQILRGFFQPWNAYMNGAMVPPFDDTVTVTKAGSGFRIHEVNSTGTLDEKYDSHLLLTEAHVVSKYTDAMAYPKFANTANGRVVSVIRTTYQTPAAPLTDITMTIAYVPVDSFQIPSTLKANYQKAGDIRIDFSACTVKTADAKPATSAKVN
jgi:hypothetical protein